MAHKIAICTHKGGTGKTVTALALSTALANAKQRTLLIDLDPQGHCSPGLGVDVDQPTLKDFFERHPTVPLSDVTQKTYLENLDIAPSHLGLAWVSEGLGGRPKREELLRRSLKQADQDYGWILMDTPPSLGVLTQNAVTAADFIVIPTLAEARAGEAIVDLLQLVQVMKGDGFDQFRILLTRVDARKTKTNATIRDVLEPYKDHVFKTEIPQSEPLNQAQMARKDIFSYDERSTGAQAYQRLLDELMTITL